MELFVSWALFPLALLLVCLGCGLLVRAAGVEIASCLLPGVGLAAAICVASLTTAQDATAELTTPLLVVLALAGYLLAWPWRLPAPGAVWPAAVAGGAVFLLYGAPVLLSGEATFAGYIKLDDTSTWLALTDRVMEHGHSLAGLAPSSYQATLDAYLGTGYPVGAFLPLGVGSQLVFTDPAWTIQPYVSLLAGLLAVSLVELARPVCRAPGVRAGVGFLAAQPALLVGYALWGGIKEVAAASLIGLIGALAAPLLAPQPRWRSLVPLGLAGIALLAVLDTGAAVWLTPIAVAGLYLLWRRSPRAALVAGAAAVVAGVVFVLTYVSGGGVRGISTTLTQETELGNLIDPLSAWQAFGIWPVGDFRVAPGATAPTAIGIGVAIFAGGAGILGAVRERSAAPVLYVASAALGCVAILVVGSPWVDGKALAIVSPALLFATALGIGWLGQSGRPGLALVAGAVVAAGVLISNFLAYREVNLAPRDQLGELERIGDQIAGEGPTLMTEFQPYGTRHFLREADPEGASGLRSRQVPLRNGKLLQNGLSADTDAIDLEALMVYRTLVLRRSPSQSRPPAPYMLVGGGRYYEVWQRPADSAGEVLEHIPLGDPVDPAGLPRCEQVLALAARAPAGAVMAAVQREPVIDLSLRETRHPDDWDQSPPTDSLEPDSAGELRGKIFWPQAGEVEVWLGGSTRSAMSASVGGETAGELRAQLNSYGQYLSFGDAHASYGWNSLSLDYAGPDLHPGSAGGAFPIGPLVLTPSEPTGSVITVSPSRARELCGRRLDWIELLSGPGQA